MKILFIAPKYMGLYEPIYKKMVQLGHEVFYMEDQTPPFYPHIRKTGLKFILYKIIHIFSNTNKKYIIFWNNCIEKYQLLNKKFDLLFCINGTCLHPYFFDKLTSINPDIKKIIYFWDTNKHYNFEWSLPYFDKAYTFDKNDAETLKINYLPNYYIENPTDNHEYKYDAFCIGSLHDGRLQILHKISKQMDKMNLSYLFKVVYIPIKDSFINKLIGYARRLFDSKDDISEREFKIGSKTHKFLCNKKYNITEYNNLMNDSKVVIDTDRQTQVGLTPRLVWAIAAGKSIITTNVNIKQSEYCPTERIWIIDRDNPIISNEMFEQKDNHTVTNKKILELEINNWIKHFLIF